MQRLVAPSHHLGAVLLPSLLPQPADVPAPLALRCSYGYADHPDPTSTCPSGGPDRFYSFVAPGTPGSSAAITVALCSAGEELAAAALRLRLGSSQWPHVCVGGEGGARHLELPPLRRAIAPLHPRHARSVPHLCGPAGCQRHLAGETAAHRARVRPPAFHAPCVARPMCPAAAAAAKPRCRRMLQSPPLTPLRSALPPSTTTASLRGQQIKATQTSLAATAVTRSSGGGWVGGLTWAARFPPASLPGCTRLPPLSLHSPLLSLLLRARSMLTGGATYYIRGALHDLAGSCMNAGVQGMQSPVTKFADRDTWSRHMAPASPTSSSRPPPPPCTTPSSCPLSGWLRPESIWRILHAGHERLAPRCEGRCCSGGRALPQAGSSVPVARPTLAHLPPPPSTARASVTQATRSPSPSRCRRCPRW